MLSTLISVYLSAQTVNVLPVNTIKNEIQIKDKDDKKDDGDGDGSSRGRGDDRR